MDFKVVSDETLRTVICTIESATEIEAGDMVDEDGSGYIAKANASSAAIAFSPFACASGTTQVEVSVGTDFVLEGTADAVFAITYKGTEVDLVMDGNDQQIDVGSSSTDVFKVDISENAGTVGSASDVRVKVNKPLF